MFQKPSEHHHLTDEHFDLRLCSSKLHVRLPPDLRAFRAALNLEPLSSFSFHSTVAEDFETPSPERLSEPNDLYEDVSSATLDFVRTCISSVQVFILNQFDQTKPKLQNLGVKWGWFKFYKSQCFRCFSNHSYLHAEVLHEPLISQEVAGHVRVSVVDERPQVEREQLQIHVLHRRVQRHVLVSNRIAATNNKLNAKKRTVNNLICTFMSFLKNKIKKKMDYNSIIQFALVEKVRGEFLITTQEPESFKSSGQDRHCSPVQSNAVSQLYL